MKLDDFYPDLEVILQESTDEAIDRLKKTDEVVSLEYFRRLKKMQGWKPLSMEDYALELRGTQLEKMNKALDDSRAEINKRVLRENKLSPKKPKKD